MPGRAETIRRLLATASVALAAATASAQTADPAETAMFRVGALSFTPDLSIPAFGVDSNVFNESENPRDDFTAVVQPAVDLWLRFGRLRLDGRQQFNLVYFKRYATERAVNTNSRLRAALDLFWVTPYAEASFIRTNDRTDGRIDTRAVNRSQPLTAGLDVRLSDSTHLDLAVSDNRTRFDDDATFAGSSLQTALDRRTRGYQGTLRYALTPPTTLSVTVSRREERFRFSPQQDSDSLRIVPGLAFAADAVVTGGVAVGWMSFTPKNDALRTFTGVVANVDVGYVFLGLTRLHLAVSRDVMPTIDMGSSYSLQTAFTGTITHRVTERWDVTASARRQRLDFGQFQLPIAGGEVVDRADTIDTFGGGVGFYFTQGLRLGVRAESINRQSVLPLGRYDNLRILGSISYALN